MDEKFREILLGKIDAMQATLALVAAMLTEKGILDKSSLVSATRGLKLSTSEESDMVASYNETINELMKMFSSLPD